MPKMTPAQAVPLLLEILAWLNEYTANRDSDDSLKLAPAIATMFFKKTLTVLKEIDDLSEDLIESFSRERRSILRAGVTEKAYRNSIFHGAASLVTIVQILKAQTNPARSMLSDRPAGSKIFIGHGRDAAWLKLQRFIEKRLQLETDDFDGVFAAGKSIPQRLSEMLDSAAFAFLVMTAEDTVTPEEIRSRQNVVHEIGLFQGRLGFDLAIVLIEEGCTSFSNLAGLVYISFPKGNIDAIFEKVRGTLEAAGLVKTLAP